MMKLLAVTALLLCIVAAFATSSGSQPDPLGSENPNAVLKKGLASLKLKVNMNRKFTKEANKALVDSGKRLDNLAKRRDILEEKLWEVGVSRSTLRKARTALQDPNVNKETILDVVEALGPQNRRLALNWAMLLVAEGEQTLKVHDAGAHFALVHWSRLTQEQLYIETKKYVDATQDMADAAFELSLEDDSQGDDEDIPVEGKEDDGVIMKRGLSSSPDDRKKKAKRNMQKAKGVATASKNNRKDLKKDLGQIGNQVASNSISKAYSKLLQKQAHKVGAKALARLGGEKLGEAGAKFIPIAGQILAISQIAEGVANVVDKNSLYQRSLAKGVYNQEQMDNVMYSVPDILLGDGTTKALVGVGKSTFDAMKNCSYVRR